MSDPIENNISDDEASHPLPHPQSPNQWEQDDGQPFADGKKKKKKKKSLYTFRTVHMGFTHNY